MPIVVKVVPKEEFAKWLENAKAGGTEVAAAAPTTATDAAPAAAAPAAEAPAAPAPEAAAAPAATEVAAAPAPAAAAPAAGGAVPKEELVKTGEKVYNANCAACHQVTGKGIPPNFPSLVDSPKVKSDSPDAQIEQILKGKNMMPPFAQLSDADIAAVVTYTHNAWGHSGPTVQADQVKALRGK
jgi:cytochrome c oxidase subunit 2